MVQFVYALFQRGGLLLLALLLLCGCSALATPQASPAPTHGAQATFSSYVGTWHVHDELLTITANATGLLQWNAGPCAQSPTQSQMCSGTATITFIANADGNLKGTVRSVSYRQWNGDPAPTEYQPNALDPRPGDSFQLQHTGAHLLYTTWFGRVSSLNNDNRYWCDSFALHAGWRQCGA